MRGEQAHWCTALQELPIEIERQEGREQSEVLIELNDERGQCMRRIGLDM